jgi:3-phosphoshikimate 1-carboxyvinyltransferase
MTALTILNKDSSLRIKNVGLNPRRTGFYKLLKKHGARIKFKNLKKINNEFVGDILVKSSKLKPIKGESNYYASTADEYPLLFVLAGLTPGISKFDGIADLANKESNRIEEVKKILKRIGIKSKSTKNSIMIFGTNKIKNKTINIPNLGDHRICMSALVLSLITGIKTNIKNFETVKTSSPSFLNIIKSLGGNFEIKKKI